jgi:hypothetical protein
MKTITTIVIALLLFTACSKEADENQLNKNIAEFIKGRTEIPQSYQPGATVPDGDTAVVFYEKHCYIYTHTFKLEGQEQTLWFKVNRNFKIISVNTMPN